VDDRLLQLLFVFFGLHVSPYRS